MSDRDYVLRLVDVTKTYGAASDVLTSPVLDAVTLDVRQGDSLAVTGPSGSGKSTLLNLMGALDRPTSGSVFLDGRDLASLNESDLSMVRNRDVGFVFQLHHLLPQCTVLENVLVPTLVGGADDDALTRAKRLLERVGLENRMDYKPGKLSGGELQRTALVRALINRPKIVLADEPTGSLDHASALNLTELLVELNREENVTLVVVSHSLELAQMMAAVYSLFEGKLLLLSDDAAASSGTPSGHGPGRAE